jgi:cation transport ATPase
MPKLTPEQEQEMLDTSLRNVRSLVDQAQAEEATKRRDAKRMFVALGIVIVLFIVVVGVFVARRPAPKTMTIQPAPAAPR